MQWTPVRFGQFKDNPKTLPQIIFFDPDWFFWAYENGALWGKLGTEAEYIYQRARSVKVPQRNGKRMLVEYFVHHNGKFGTMQLIPAGPSLEGLNVSSVIDFKVPRICAQRDGMGNNNFIAAFKAIYFGNRSKRMTKRICEEFFNDDRNFDLD